MLKNIKSSFFNSIIFSYIDEKQKLKLNKCLQKNLNISIINYMYLSNKYIIYESNGIRNEYIGYNDRLIFEGEYLNGKRNGKGREYNDYGRLIFEGEYLNDERNGKGTSYDIDSYGYYGYSKIIFKGEYLNDEPIYE